MTRRLLVAAAAVATALTLVRIVVFWTNQAYLDTGSGVWTALAVDLSSGVFYRPAVGPDGFGGTRYFPLLIVLQAGVMALVGDPIRAGQITALLSVTLVCAGVYASIRALRGSPLLAGASALTVLASQTTQEALLSIKGDALPAGLNLLGAALAFRSDAARGRMLGPAVLFTLAFAAKPTAVYGVMATVVWLMTARRVRQGATLAALTAGGGALVLALAHLLSGGRALPLWWTAATSGTGADDTLRAPFTFAQLARQVPETLVFIQLGLAAVVAISLRARRVNNEVTLLMLAVLAITVPIFVFEGTDTNHLIDLMAVSVVAVAAFIAIPDRVEADFATAALAVATLAASLSLATGLANRAAEQRHGTFAQALALVPDRDRPILAENPLVPIAAGQRPYMLDSYMFRLLREDTPSLGEPLFRNLEHQAFSAVVLERDPHDERGRAWYGSALFGDGFIEALEQHYELAGMVGMRVVYRPRPRQVTLP